MNIEITIALILFFIGIPVTIFVGNPYQRYENKIQRIKTALLGYLEESTTTLREVQTGNGATRTDVQENRYKEFIQFMQDSHFLQYANEYEDMLDYEKRLEKQINKVALLCPVFIIPTLLLQMDDGSLFSLGVMILYIFSLFVLTALYAICKKLQRINKLYGEYIIDKQSFGGYTK